MSHIPRKSMAGCTDIGTVKETIVRWNDVKDKTTAINLTFPGATTSLQK